MIGMMLGPYRVLEKLGEGGMGEVYRARDTRLDRTVAIKVLPAAVAANPERRARFEREARTVGGLNHPHICSLHDVGREGDVIFLVMEHVVGETLAARLLHGPLPLEQALTVAAEIADALAAAHSQGVVHRDLKPGNVMLTRAGSKLLDFGLARLTGHAEQAETTVPASAPTRTASLTQEGVILGTVQYMAPEQLQGKPAEARTDVWALGAMLYEMVAGRRPFSGDSWADALASTLRDSPPPLVGVAPDVVRIVERCLRRDVAERFASAIELKAAIAACLVPGARRQARPSVAVMPFAHMTGAKDDEYLCEGLAEEIINALTPIPGLRVIARTSAFAAARMGLDARETGARLDVGHLLGGSVRRDGRRVRVTVQLVSTSDGSQVWSERYDRELTNVLVLEDEIAQEVSRKLRVELAPRDRERAQPVVDAEAHAAYLEGRYHFARGSPDALAKAMACYQRALARDPGSALVYDSLAELLWYLGFFGNMPPRDAFSQSTWYALRALELDDSLAQTHALLGMLRKELDYNWPEVDRELRRAFELNEQCPLVRLRYAISGLLPHGRVREASLELEALLRGDPLSLLVRWWSAVMAFLARQPHRTIEEARHMIELEPMHFLGHWALGIGLNELDRRPDAVLALERAHELSGGAPFTLGFLGYMYGCAGRTDDVRRLLGDAENLAAAGYTPPSAFAMCYIGMNDWDSAFKWIDRAVEARDPIIMPIKTFPFLDPVRDDARFRAVVHKMGLD